MPSPGPEPGRDIMKFAKNWRTMPSRTPWLRIISLTKMIKKSLDAGGTIIRLLTSVTVVSRCRVTATDIAREINASRSARHPEAHYHRQMIRDCQGIMLARVVAREPEQVRIEDIVDHPVEPGSRGIVGIMGVMQRCLRAG